VPRCPRDLHRERPGQASATNPPRPEADKRPRGSPSGSWLSTTRSGSDERYFAAQPADSVPLVETLIVEAPTTARHPAEAYISGLAGAEYVKGHPLTGPVSTRPWAGRCRRTSSPRPPTSPQRRGTTRRRRDLRTRDGPPSQYPPCLWTPTSRTQCPSGPTSCPPRNGPRTSYGMPGCSTWTPLTATAAAATRPEPSYSQPPSSADRMIRCGRPCRNHPGSRFNAGQAADVSAAVHPRIPTPPSNGATTDVAGTPTRGRAGGVLGETPGHPADKQPTSRPTVAMPPLGAYLMYSVYDTYFKAGRQLRRTTTFLPTRGNVKTARTGACSPVTTPGVARRQHLGHGGSDPAGTPWLQPRSACVPLSNVAH